MVSSRATLLLLNTFFFLIGCAILTIGLWSQYDKNFSVLWNSLEMSKVIDAKSLNGASLLLIISGIMSVFVSFIGLYGSLRKDKCFLGTYCILMCIILILEIAAASVFMTYQKEAKIKLREGLNETINDINTENDKAALSVMNTIQNVFKCCGCEGPSDYLNVSSITTCQRPESTSDNPVYYEKGCYNAIVEYIDTHLPVLLGISIVLIIFQLFCLVVSIKSCVNIRYEGYEDI